MVTVLLLLALGNFLLHPTDAGRNRECQLECLQQIILQKPDGQFVIVEGPATVPLTKIIDIIIQNRSSRFVTFRLNHKDYFIPEDARPIVDVTLREHPFIEEIIEMIFVRHLQVPGYAPTGRPFEKTEPFPVPGVTTTVRPWGETEEEYPLTETGHYTEHYQGGTTEWPVVSPQPDMLNVPITDEEIPNEVGDVLDLLERNPSGFATVVKTLEEKGVRLPSDLTVPIRYIIINGKKYRLKTPITPKVPLDLDGTVFDLPADAGRFLNFVTQNPGKLPAVLTVIKQISGRPLIRNGRIVGFVILGKLHRLPRPLAVVIPVNGVTYRLPEDLDRLMNIVRGKPEVLYRLLPLLEFYGFKVRNAPDGRITSLVFDGRTYPVNPVTPIHVTIDDVLYSIPRDLPKILFHPDRRRTGKLLRVLQSMEVPLDVDPLTGTIRGIVVEGVLVPFPAFVNLRIRYNGRDYNIPRDIPQLITMLENEPLSAKDVAYIYEITGISPVRSPDNDVIGLRFNGQTYPMRPQRKTSLVINGVKYVLPRDNDRLANDLATNRVTVEDFLDRVQASGYTILFNADGTVSSIVKGVDLLYLPVRIALRLNLSGQQFAIPRDLRKLAALLSSLQGSVNIDQVLVQLHKVGVQVERDKVTNRIVLVFNQQKVPVVPRPTQPPYKWPIQPEPQLRTTTPESSWEHGETIEGVPTPGTGPDILDVPLTDEQIPDDLDDALDGVGRNPSSFITVINTLEKKGVRFPSDLTKPILFIVVNGKRYRLKTPITPKVPLDVDGTVFDLPTDAGRFLNFVTQNPEKLPAVLTVIRQISGRPVIRNGRIVGFVILGKLHRLPRPLAVVIPVNGVAYRLPGDLDRLMNIIRGKPKELYRLLPLLEFYGFKVRNAPDGRITSLVFDGRTYPVKPVTPIHVTIDDVVYSIPRDLPKILFHPDRRRTGKLLRVLQSMEVPLDVDPLTGTIRGIVVEGVLVPFPAFVNLRIRYNGRDYNIPRDIPQLITMLETEPLSPKDVAYIYEITGISPVRSPDNDVIGLRFNGQTYPMRPQRKTSLVINGVKYVLPRDNDRLANDLATNRVTVEDFLDRVQASGYTILFNADGTVSSIVKGVDLLYLPVRIALRLNLNGQQFAIPRDLRKLAALLSSLQATVSIDQVLGQLHKVGVQVERNSLTKEITLVFNQQRVLLGPGPAQPAVTSEPRGTEAQEGGWEHEQPPEAESTPTRRPDILDVPVTDEDIPDDLEAVLEGLERNPSSFATVVSVLEENGVRLPDDLTKPIVFIVVNGKRYRLKTPITPKVPVDLDGTVFDLPTDIPKLLDYTTRHSEKLPIILTVIKQINGRPIIKDGRIVGFTILRREYRLPEPIGISVRVNGVKYNLPEDSDNLLRTVGTNPEELHRLLDLLEFYGFHVKRAYDGRILSLTFHGRTYPVTSVTPVQITIDDVPYSIPADLKKILFHRDRRLTGKLLLELQKKGIRLDIDPITATIRGVIMEGILVPFPAFVNLRIRYNGKDYSIPRDIPRLIAVLESQPLSPKDMAYIYETTGISPVRSYNNDITGLRFNGQTYPMTPQKETALVIKGVQYVLPRDNDKLADDLVSGKVTTEDFLEKVQAAGYTVLFNSNGTVSSVLKGVDILYLPVRIWLRLNIDGKRYEIPRDLAKIASYISALSNPKGVDYVLEHLRKLGVRVQRDPHTHGITLLFNEQKIPVHVKPIVLEFEGRTFELPKEMGALIAFVRTNNIPTEALIAALERKHVKVTLGPNGEIISASVGGFVYPVSDPLNRPPSGGVVVLLLNGVKFELPKDVGKFADFIRTNNIDLESIRPTLENEGVQIQVGPNNELVSLTIGGDVYPTNRPSSPVDISAIANLTRNLKEQPWLITDVLAKIEKLRQQKPGTKVDVKKRPDGSVISVSIDGQTFQVPHIQGVDVVIHGEKYTFPQDFGIFFSKLATDPTLAAKLVVQLQASHQRLIVSSDKITGVVIGERRYLFPRPLSLFLEAGDHRMYAVPSGIEDFIKEVVASQGRKRNLEDLVATIRSAGVIPYILRRRINLLYFNGKSYYVVKPLLTTVAVIINGRVIRIPQDIKEFLKMKKHHQATFGDLIVALHSAGAQTVTDIGGTVVGFKLNGKKGLLGIRFKSFINIGGHQYAIPGQIGEIAKALSGGNYDWDVVRKTLQKEGLTVEEGEGAKIRIGFEGQFYGIKKGMPKIALNLFGKKHTFPQDIHKVVRHNLGKWTQFESTLRSIGMEILLDPDTKVPKRFIYQGIEYDVPPEGQQSLE